MLKYIPEAVSVVAEEIPERISLAVEISNCKGNCVGCHSPFLRLDIGEELTFGAVKKLYEDNFGVNCLLFLGEGNDCEALLGLARKVKRELNISIALYSGRTSVEDDIWQTFDYVKIGPYIPSRGPLNSRTTNQRLYKISADGQKTDITYKFWAHQD